MCQLSFAIICYSLSLWYNLSMGEYKGFTPSRRKANDKYMTEKIDSLSIYVPKGQKELIKAAAKKKGLSMNQFVVEAINAALRSDTDT